MKNFKKIAAGLLSLTLCLGFTESYINYKEPVSALELIPDIEGVWAEKTEIGVGESIPVEVEINFDHGSRYIHYTSDKPSVAAVNDNGLVTGIAPGEATITVWSGATGISMDLTITVTDYEAGDINCDGAVSLSDGISLKKFLIGKNTFSDKQFKTADMNEDGKVNAFDFTILRKKLVDLFGKTAATDLTAEITPYPIEQVEPGKAFADSQINFAVDFFKNTASGDKNTLVSPYSVSCALALALNGADGQTLEQMRNTVCGDMLPGDFNSELASYERNQPDDDGCKLLTANSVWTKNDGSFTADKDFLRTVKSYFGAEIFSSPFDQSTVDDLNGWINKNTDGMIPQMINEINPRTVMMLANAVTFDANWQKKYTESVDTPNFFTAIDGTKQDASLLHSSENVYLEDENSTGFLKYYEGKRYAFAAILPNENTDINDYVQDLTGDKFRNLMENAQELTVSTCMPVFKSEYSDSLVSCLRAMGMKDAFDPSKSDFSKLGKCSNGANTYISNIIHKTFIEVNTEGTRAAAATLITNAPTCPLVTKFVELNRPFVYAIVDTETNIPIFMGTQLTLN